MLIKHIIDSKKLGKITFNHKIIYDNLNNNNPKIDSIYLL
jgi:hypothetical protein